jgi:hypothetical protein
MHSPPFGQGRSLKGFNLIEIWLILQERRYAQRTSIAIIPNSLYKSQGFIDNPGELWCKQAVRVAVNLRIWSRQNLSWYHGKFVDILAANVPKKIAVNSPEKLAVSAQ